jgi:hypothetical protein
MHDTRAACQQRSGTDAALVPACQAATACGQTDATQNGGLRAPRMPCAAREMGSVRMLGVVPFATVQSWGCRVIRTVWKASFAVPMARACLRKTSGWSGANCCSRTTATGGGCWLQPGSSCDARGGECFGDQPDREDQLEEATGDQREQPGAVSDVDQVEHGQDRAD